MGIGAAFATGLVKGFTQNIEKEEAKRLAEQAKVDAFEQTALQAVVTGKATKSGYSAAADLIKSARQQMKDRKPIDMFGRATDGLDLDFAKLQGTLEDATEYGTTFGTGQNKIGFNVDISKGIDGKLGRSYLSEVAGFAMDKNFETKLDSLSDSEFVKFYNSMGASRRAIIDAEKKSGKDLYEAPDVMGGENSQTYRGLYKLDSYYAKRFGGLQPVGATEGSSLNEIDVQTTAIAEAHKVKTGRMPDSVGLVQTDSGTNQYPMLFYTKDSEKKQLEVIAQRLGTSTTSLLAHWQTGFMAIPGISSEDQVRALDTSVSLGTQVSFIGELDPDAQLRMMNQESIDNVTKIAIAAGATDLQTFAYALAPYMEGPKRPQRPSEWGSVRQIPSETVQRYILGRVYGEDKAKTVSFKDFRDGQTALETTYNKIIDLETEIKGLDAPLAYDKFKGKLTAVFDLEQGLFGGVAKDLGIPSRRTGELNLDDDENLTVEYSEHLSELVRRADKTGGVQAAKLEAMRISLAFEMARAADPSGRLSNQDIEQQLRKLGTDWQTVDQAVAAIQVAKNEFSLKAEQYKVLVRLGESQKTATERDYKIIDATIAADHLLRNRGVKRTTGAVASDTPQVDISNIVKTPSGKLVDSSTGLPATDEQSKAFNLKTVLDSTQQQQGQGT